MELKEFHNKDMHKAIQFAIDGMHLDLYLQNKTLLKLYGRYFWYLETNRATQIIAAYEGDTLAGVLLAEINGETKKYYSKWRAMYVKFVDFIQQVFFKESAGLYDDVNKEMFAKYKETHSPDGEIIFLAANPDVKVKGIGSMLLNELTDREKGKQIYLYTDKNVTDKIVQYLKENNISYIQGLTWTTDAIFRETAERIAQRKTDGAKIVEMEQSGCIAVAQYRGFDYGALIYGGDDVSQEEWSNRGWRSREGIRYDLVMLCKELVNVI